MTKKEISIDGRVIGGGNPPYIIAELSANHNGSIEKAFETIEMAKEMGADAIKIQTYTADTMTIDCDKEDFQIHGGLWDGYNLYKLYQWAQTPYEWHEALFQKAREVGITLFSTSFDETAVELLEKLENPVYKIASFELTDLPLIKRVAETGKPMIMSTGLANFEEIAEAVNTARNNGCNDLVLLHCISGYPTPPEESNLRVIPDLAEKFGVISGLSDHTLGTMAPIAAVALGASVIEKHVTLSRADKGPDCAFSLEPDELKTLCRESKIAWKALGKPDYSIKAAEAPNTKYRRSIYVTKNVTKGDYFSKENIRVIRPSFGMAPKYYEKILGKIATQDIERGDPLDATMVEGFLLE